MGTTDWEKPKGEIIFAFQKTQTIRDALELIAEQGCQIDGDFACWESTNKLANQYCNPCLAQAALNRKIDSSSSDSEIVSCPTYYLLLPYRWKMLALHQHSALNRRACNP